METTAKLDKRSNVMISSMKKLDKDEQSAFAGLFADMGATLKAAKISDKTLDAKLKRIIREVNERMRERFNVKWMASDGSTFDNWGEYMRHQWGKDVIVPDDPF